ncbi:hypothetical protein NL676_025262 [Syzygium grande]|nr:hypothetical protein NL676_025262 [Syzygium grande]
MITRSNLAEQLREYQIRSKRNWSTVSFFSSTSTPSSSSRVDVVVFVIRERIILAFLVFSAVSLYFRRNPICFYLGMPHSAAALMHENCEENKIR